MDPLVISSSSKVVASDRQATADVDGEAIILNFDEGVYYALESVGARTWELLREPRTVIELRDALSAEYDVALDRCESDLRALLSELALAGLIEVVNETSG